MSEIFKIQVSPSQAGERLDKFIADKVIGLTRSGIHKLLLEGCISLNGIYNPQKNYRTCSGDAISVYLPCPQPIALEAENIPLNIAYEDDDLLVVNKEPGMVVHPAPGHESGTLVNALMFHVGKSLLGIGGKIRPGIVHRIDKDTSGLLIVAKNDTAHQSLAMQIKEHSLLREYEALAYGTFKSVEGTIDAPIGRDPRNRKRMCVTAENSKKAVTKYTIIKSYNDFSHIRLKLQTGRTHQIRVHMAHIGHSLVGDPVYGARRNVAKFEVKGQCLHSKLIRFSHPRSGKYIEIQSQLPQYFLKYLE